MASTGTRFRYVSAIGLALLLISCVQAQRCTPEDEDALLKFKQDLHCNVINDPTNSPCPLDSWVAGTDCCTWDGVGCDTSSHRVIGVSITGTISLPSTFQITRSASSSSFGRSIFRLTQLQNLELTFVDLNTYLPGVWGSISTLKSLVIRGGRIYGEIPKEYGKLINLESFEIENAAFDVPVPAVGLSGKLGIPRELCKLSKLVRFNLRYFTLSGSIPNCIDRWSRIEEFSIRNGGGNGDGGGRDPRSTIPNAVGLTGVLPASLGKLKTLKSLDLNTNRLTGTLPSWIGNLRNLQSLNLGMNRFSGQLPKELGNLRNLQFLYLNSNRWSGKLPFSLGNLSQLVSLDLGSNRFSGGIPESIFNVFTLEELRLDDNQFSGPLPKGNLPGSRSTFGLRLNISQNYISGPLNPNLLPPNTQDLYLCCQNGRLAGTGIPASISVLQSLNILDLHDNQLGGPIPSSFSLLPDLSQVDLSYNNLTGPIPPAIKALGTRANLEGNPLLGP